MSGLLDQPVLVLKEKISYAQFRITDEVGVTIFDGAEAELVRFDGSVRQQAQLSDATGAPIGTVRKVGAGIWRSLNGENDYRIDFVGEPSEDLRLLIIAGSFSD